MTSQCIRWNSPASVSLPDARPIRRRVRWFEQSHAKMTVMSSPWRDVFPDNALLQAMRRVGAMWCDLLAMLAILLLSYRLIATLGS